MSPSSRKPLVTVVIPTYQRPHLLPRAVESVLAQTFRDLRVLVCDNASGDETAEVMQEFARHDPRVEYRVQPRNLGPVANFNYGLQQVQTPFFVLLSDDNVLAQDFLARAVRVLQEQPTRTCFWGTPSGWMVVGGSVLVRWTVGRRVGCRRPTAFSTWRSAARPTGRVPCSAPRS